MSVNPGFGGQKFIPKVLEKIRELNQIRETKGLGYDIEIDGERPNVNNKVNFNIINFYIH